MKIKIYPFILKDIFILCLYSVLEKNQYEINAKFLAYVFYFNKIKK